MLALAACVHTPPIHPEADKHNTRAAEALERNELVLAQVECEHALEFSPEYAEAEVNCALIAWRRGDVKAAKQRLTRALHLNQELAAAWNTLGALELEQREYASARRRFERALKVNPDDAPARRNLAVAWTRLGDFGRAENAWRHLVVSHPRLSEPYGALGELALVRGDAKEAVAMLETAVLLEPEWPEAWNLLVKARVATGDRAGADDARELCRTTQRRGSCDHGR